MPIIGVSDTVVTLKVGTQRNRVRWADSRLNERRLRNFLPFTLLSQQCLDHAHFLERL